MRFWRRNKSQDKTKDRNRDKSARIVEVVDRVSPEMKELLKNATKESCGDPFYQYRTEKILPEKFIYGMNCYFDRIAEQYGDDYAQKVYEVIRRNPSTYTIQKNSSGVDLTDVPILFTVKLGAAVDAENIVRNPEVLPELFQIEPEPESNVGLEAFIESVNEHLLKEDSLTVIKVKLAKLKSFSGKLSDNPVGSMIVYKSRIGQYYNFLKIARALDKNYAYGPENRKVPLSYITDKSNELILITPMNMRHSYFKAEHELSQKSISKIEMVYKYKPISDTLKHSYEVMQK